MRKTRRLFILVCVITLIASSQILHEKDIPRIGHDKDIPRIGYEEYHTQKNIRM